MKEISRLEGGDIDDEFDTPEKIEVDSKKPENIIFGVAREVQVLQNEWHGIKGAKGSEEEAILLLNKLQAKNAELSDLLRKVPYETQMAILQMLGRN